MNNSSTRVTIWSRNFVCVLIANSLLALSHSSVNTLVATYASHLGAGPKLMGLLTGMFFAVALAMRPVAGPVITNFDKRKLMILVYSLGFVVNMGYALFHNITAFVIFRFFNGVQYALIGSLCITIAGDSLPPEKMASGLGVFGIGSAAATSIAPSVGIWLKELGTSMRDVDLGFTFVFILAAVSMGVALVPCFLLKHDNKTKEEAANAGKWYTNIATKNAIAPAIIMMLLVISYSLYTSYMVNFGTELSIGNIGIFFTVLACVMLCSRPMCGALTDKYGLRRIIIPGMLIFAVSFVMVSFSRSLASVLVGAVAAAIGYGAANPAAQTMCMQCEPPIKRGVASNTMYIGMDLGFFLGPVIGGYIYSAADYKTVILAGGAPTLIACVVFICAWPSFKRRVSEIQAQL